MMPDMWGNGEISISEVIGMERENAKLRERIQQLESRLALAERERDAAVRDLEVADKLDCEFCVHNRPTPGCVWDCEKCEKKCTCNLCRNNDKYAWRGPCPENTPDHAKE